MAVANTSWYRKGTASPTINSTKVTGSGTNWLTAGINPGATFRVDRQPYAYEVAEVVSDTELRLAQPYFGNSGTGLSYSIDRNFQSTLPSKISADLMALMSLYEQVRDGATLTIQGKDAYEVAVEAGYTGTRAQWLESLKAAGELLTLDSRTNILTYHNAGTHNAQYRGKNLGNAFTEAQSTAIRAGTFDDLYAGDAWSFSNVPYTYYMPTSDLTAQKGKTYYANVIGTALTKQPEESSDIAEAGYYEVLNAIYSGIIRIGGCDYYFRAGDVDLSAHSICVIPDTFMFTAPMNETNTTEGGYAGSKMRTLHLKRAEAIFKACFGEANVLSHRKYLVNAVKDGKASGGAWYDSLAELMDERMVYGAPIFDSASTDGGNTIPNRYSANCKHLPLFAHCPDLISNRQLLWLRNVVSAAYFASVNNNGICLCTNASNAGSGVRPASLPVGFGLVSIYR